MEFFQALHTAGTMAPMALMAAMAALAHSGRFSSAALWRGFHGLALAAVAASALVALVGPGHGLWPALLEASPFSLVMALLVQGLGTVIGRFSSRYLQGEAGQARYMAALAAVLAAVHLLLMANHWLVLIAAWAGVGMALQPLLCFFPERAFARLAAHKKRIADRVADALLLAAAALAWVTVGSGSLSDLWLHVAQQGMSTPLQLSALALVLAVVLRTALLPVHGWLIQVMEAPTPVSALLHAGVVNLGGFVLIRFAPMLEHAAPARAVLLVFGLATAVLAGMVMLTRISIKVRLAWSTVAQMGFMVMECALGLYTLAALHLIGHSLYKAHAFLSASTVVRDTRLQAMHSPGLPWALSLVLAPVVTVSAVFATVFLVSPAAWPAWWSVVLGLAWAPLLWVSTPQAGPASQAWQLGTGVLMVAGLTAVALVAHALPWGIEDAPHHGLGLVAVAGMGLLYLGLALLQKQPQLLSRWRRWSYAGFYVDEAYTRLALQLWPAQWAPDATQGSASRVAKPWLADAPR
jgi:NAD(P)H-quinone oxidoreductase subunit 5